MINNAPFGEFVTYQSASVRKQQQLYTNRHGRAQRYRRTRDLRQINEIIHSPFAFSLT